MQKYWREWSNVHKPFYRPPCRPGYLSPIIFPYKSIQPHHSQDLNSACAVPVQKIRRFKLALLLVARTIAFSLPTPIPFALHTHRRHCLSSFSYRAIIFPYSRHPPPPLSLLLPRRFHHHYCRFTSNFHSYFHSIPSSPRFESGMRSPVQKGRFKEVLIGHGNAIPHSLSHVLRTSHHKRSLPLIVLSSPLLPKVSSSSCFFSPTDSLVPSSWSPPTHRPSPRMPDRIHRKGQPLPRFCHPRVCGATRIGMIRKQGRR